MRGALGSIRALGPPFDRLREGSLKTRDDGGEGQAEWERGERRRVRPEGAGEGAEHETFEKGEEAVEESDGGGHWGRGCEDYTNRVRYWGGEVKDGKGEE